MSTLSLSRVQVQVLRRISLNLSRVQVLERSKDNFEGFYSFTQRIVYQCHLTNFVTFIRREIVLELRIWKCQLKMSTLSLSLVNLNLYLGSLLNWILLRRNTECHSQFHANRKKASLSCLYLNIILKFLDIQKEHLDNSMEAQWFVKLQCWTGARNDCFL